MIGSQQLSTKRYEGYFAWTEKRRNRIVYQRIQQAEAKSATIYAARCGSKGDRMQIKCQFCAMPFALTTEQVKEAIELLQQNPQGHYDARCPKCRRVTKLAKRAFTTNPLTRKLLTS